MAGPILEVRDLRVEFPTRRGTLTALDGYNVAICRGLVLGVGGGWAIVTAFAAAGGLIFFFYALSKGDASVVVPTTSAYPIVTLIGAAIFLSESLTLPRVIGTALVIAGVVVIST